MDTTATIYTTPTCHFCQMTKEFFKENGVTYTEHDVSADLEKRQEMVDMTNQMGVPVIVINNEVTIGFDKKRLESLLGIAG